MPTNNKKFTKSLRPEKWSDFDFIDVNIFIFALDLCNLHTARLWLDHDASIFKVSGSELLKSIPRCDVTY